MKVSATGQCWQLLTQMELSVLARRMPDGSVSISRWQGPERFMFGPHLRLGRGNYRLHFVGKASYVRVPEHPVLGVEIIAQNRFVRAWGDFTARELDTGMTSMDFVVDDTLDAESGISAPFEFRLLCFINADLMIHGLSLERLADNATLSASLAPLHLIGRFYLPRFFRSGEVQAVYHEVMRPGVIRLSSVTRTGRTDWPCHPRFSLPHGAYQLELRGSALHIGGSGRTALRVAVETDQGVCLGQHDITAADLKEGLACFDFTVPEDLGAEMEEDIWFQLRVNGALGAFVSLREINLHSITRSSVDLPAPLIARARARLLMVGNCQAGMIASAVRDHAALSHRFRAKHQFVELPENLHEQGKRDLQACDVLMVQDIREWKDYPLRTYVPDTVRVIKFPCLRFGSLWPFDAFMGPDDGEARRRDHPNFEFTYFDGLLGRLRKEIPDPVLRFEAYRTLAVPGLIDIRRLHDFESRRLRAMDKKFGGQIGAYILENFSSQRLFHTIGHPSGQLLEMLILQLFRELDFHGGVSDKRKLDGLNALQVPVHPLVGQSLGVHWAHERTHYRFKGHNVTWDDYIKQYILYYG